VTDITEKSEALINFPAVAKANEGFHDLATWLILISIPKPKL